MIRYVLRRVRSSLRENWAVSAITISTVAAAAFVLAVVALALANLERAADRWTREAPIVAYLADDLSPEAVRTLEASALGHADVSQVTRVSKDEA
ncbi:MAG: hypothetical protein K8I02_05295, partial [Candidatus Methylomirabilis sp.]|nr:hypothetical protein [Deltaproteobacteria bacterium]